MISENLILTLQFVRIGEFLIVYKNKIYNLKTNNNYETKISFRV